MLEILFLKCQSKKYILEYILYKKHLEIIVVESKFSPPK